MALYEPGMGYYQAGSAKIGEAGDFITAPETGSLFASCLAGQCAEILHRCLPGDRIIVEFGAGSGRLALDLLDELEKCDALPDRYLVVETSPDLAKIQRQRFAAEDRFRDLVHWSEDLPESITGVVIGNELLDALPVIRFEVGDDGTVSELGVVVGEGGEFRWQTSPMPLDPNRHKALIERLGDVSKLSGYRSEAGLQGEAWVREVAGRLKQGAIILADYGFPESEYYHPDRRDGTLMCHFQHTVHPDPFRYPGSQDITAHVDFSAVARAGSSAGMTVAGFATQGQFLLALDLLDLYQAAIEACGIGADTLVLSGEIKKLTLPHEMGELFKVLVLTREIDPALRGFSRQNMAGRL